MAERPVDADELAETVTQGTASGSARPDVQSVPPLPDGETIARRYVLRRLLGKGGMGEVYLAHDLVLREDVALKTLRRERFFDDSLGERLLREVQLARRVTHEHVCRIFDVGEHATGAGTTPFLTMQLLVGRTIGQRVRQSGALPEAEVRRIALQLCDALAAAHRAGVVHRDFKSDNVVLLERPGGTHAVVTDFGLAHEWSGGTDALGTGARTLVGSPAYMAPEQVQCLPLSPRTDLYALGVVLYEMLSGRLPFSGDSAMEVATRRLTQPPPRLDVQGLDPRWEAVVRRCLAIEPEARFSDAGEARAAIEAIGRRRRGPLLAVAAAVITLAVVGGVTLSRRSSKGTVGRRASVAVLGLRQVGTQPGAAWIGTALEEMLTTELASSEALRTVPAERVAAVRDQMRLFGGDPEGAAAQRRLAEQLGADFALAGTYTVVGDAGARSLRLDLELREQGGETLRLAETGPESALFALAARAGQGLRQRLGASTTGGRASGPAGTEAFRAYSEGLALLRAHDPGGARSKLEASLAHDPHAPAVHAALARALGALGHDAEARRAAERALAESTGLPRAERLQIEALALATAADWARAIEIRRSLVTFFPDDPELQHDLVTVLTRGGRFDEAMAALDALARLPGRDDVRIASAEAWVATKRSDCPRAERAGRRAIELARAQGRPAAALEAARHLGWALRCLGKTEEARRTWLEAKDAYARAGDRRGLASIEAFLGDLDVAAADFRGARRHYEAELALARELGDRDQIADALNTLGIACNIEGALGQALEHYRQARQAYSELDDKEGVANTTGNLGITEVARGRFAAGLPDIERAVEAHRRSGSKMGQGGMGAELAWAELELGHLDRALDAARDAERVLVESGARTELGRARAVLAWIQRARRRPEEAERHAASALELHTAAGDRSDRASVLVLSATLALERRDAARAEAQAREAADVGKALALRWLEAHALSVQAEALLALGRRADARAALLAARTAGEGVEVDLSRRAISHAEKTVR